MSRLLLIIALLFPSTASAQAIYGGRQYNAPVCNRPNCAMCNQIRAQLAAQQVVQSSAYVSAPLAVSNDVEYEVVQVPVVTQVKRCNGVACWYENVTTYRTERRPIRNAIKAAVDFLKVDKLVPTPHDAVVEMLAIASPGPDEVLYDLGCGDGRILIAASTAYGCRSVGIELNPVTYQHASTAIGIFGLRDRVRVYQGDVLTFDYPHADIVTMYLYPELMERVLPRLRPGTRVISYMHPIRGGTRITIRDHVFYTWTVE